MNSNWRAGIVLLVAAAVPGVLTKCSYSIECDRVVAAIVMPVPGDSVTLRGRACLEGAQDAAVIVRVDGEGSMRLLVGDPADGPAPGTETGLTALIYPTASDCDEGFEITVENTEPAGESLSAVLWLIADAEEFDRCDVLLEEP